MCIKVIILRTSALQIHKRGGVYFVNSRQSFKNIMNKSRESLWNGVKLTTQLYSKCLKDDFNTYTGLDQSFIVEVRAVQESVIIVFVLHI